MNPEGPVIAPSTEFERVLRTLPDWFGIEASLREYAADTQRWPTFVARIEGRIAAFLTVHAPLPADWELHCIAVEARYRHQRIGSRLHAFAERWLCAQGARQLQVKTLAASHPSPAYAETREFYEQLGYLPHEVFAEQWAPHLPVQQLVKALA